MNNEKNDDDKFIQTPLGGGGKKIPGVRRTFNGWVSKTGKKISRQHILNNFYHQKIF